MRPLCCADREYLVVERATRVLGGGGFSALSAGDKEVCELQRMYFDPEIRGLGLGPQTAGGVSGAGDRGWLSCLLRRDDGRHGSRETAVSECGFSPPRPTAGRHWPQVLQMRGF